jgi:hypothetical protein
MSMTTRARRNSRKMRPGLVQRRRWACPDEGCTQERITDLNTRKAPICPEHACQMTKRRKVTRRLGF